jgi:REP element-mobilizing transposase RayT
MYVHIIFPTKGWQLLITSSMMVEIIGRLKRNFELKGAEMLLANGREEHVHILGKFLDYQSFSRIVGWAKGECSHWINQRYPNLEFYWQKGFWHELVSEDKLRDVEKYIHNQASVHEELTFHDEITKFRKA